MRTNRWKTLLTRLRCTVRRRRLEKDLEEEQQFHLEMAAHDLAGSGMTREAAAYESHCRFGNATALKEQSHELFGFRRLESWVQDVRYGLRAIRRSPGFTAVAVLSLALGIGANTVVFSIVNTVFLRPLPWSEAERITRISLRNEGDEKFPVVVYPADRESFERWRRQTRLFERVAAVSLAPTGLSLTGLGEAEHHNGTAVSSNFFALLRVQPELGRTFFEEEDRPGRANVAVLSHEFWRKRFASDAAVIGRSLLLNGQAHTVIGVMPAGFKAPEWYLQKETEVWLPLDPSKDLSGKFMGILGRLKPGVSLPQAEAEASAIAGRDQSGPRRYCRLAPLAADYQSLRPHLTLLFGVSVLVLLVACANVGNIVLARATARLREIGTRVALGAGRLRIVRQLLTESVLLAAIAGVAALLLAQGSIAVLRHARPAELPRVDELSLDWLVFVFAGALSLGAGLAVGLLSALQASRPGIAVMLGGSSGRSGESRLASRGREALIAVQMAFSVVLLTAAGLLLRSLLALDRVDLGFDPRNTLTFSVKLPDGAPDARTHRFFAQLRERLAEIPGVRAAGYTNFGPPLEGTGSLDLIAAGSRIGPDRPLLTMFRNVSPGYFQALGIPLMQGGDFTERHIQGRRNEVIVNETLARRHWPGMNAIGRLVHTPGNEASPMRIIGVAKDVLEHNRAALPEQEVYFPGPGSTMETMIIVRASSALMGLNERIRGVVAAVDPAIAPYQVRRLETVVSDDLGPRTFLTGAVALCAAIAACLAAIGLFGVVSYAASRRAREIGIRIALGASYWSILQSLGGRVLMVSAAGLAAGVAGSWTIGGLIHHFLFGVGPHDPATVAAVVALLIAVALVAIWLPARRQAMSDPMRALKCE